MLKTISSITNALGALNYKGTWNASTNTPTLTSSVGTKGDYYVVSVAGSTSLNGEALWGVGDWAVFNGSVWQRVEGGDTINATIVTTPIVQAASSAGLALKNASGTTQLSLGAGGGDNITLSVATNITPANANVAISPTGTGTVTINPATASTINNTSIGATTALAGRFTDVTLTTGNLIVSNGQGINFSATPGTGTSELLADYEEGTWTPNQGGGLTVVGAFSSAGTYTKVGRLVTVNFSFTGATSVACTAGGNLCTNLPFVSANASSAYPGSIVNNAFTAGGTIVVESGFSNVWTATTLGANPRLSCSATYFV